MPLKAPSVVQPTAIPVFALKWATSPYIAPTDVLVYAGGGGSAKTGIGNTVKLVIGGRDITIDTGVEIGVAIDILITETRNIYVAIGISDSVRVYLVREDAEEVGSFDFEKGSGVNALSWDAFGNAIVAGCEDGKVYILSAEFEAEGKLNFEQKFALEGHIKAVCSSSFHPKNPNVLITSAKDGTCRVWNLGAENKCMEVLECKIYDPKGPKPKQNILNPKPGQLLVRGCAFGDLDGRVVYTIQSGRKGGAFLSVWKLIRKAVEGEKVIPPDNPNGPPQQKFILEFRETLRKQVSKFPVSAMSLSGDYSTLALGDTDGSVTLLSTHNFKPIKFWECAHDLPVTCIAARPLPLPLSGEDLTGVAVDAMSASADNKLCLLTKQRRSTLKPKREGGKGSSSGSFYLFSLLVFALIIFTIKVSFDVCQDQFVGLDDILGVKQCVLHTVLWASSDRPGVAFIPH